MVAQEVLEVLQGSVIDQKIEAHNETSAEWVLELCLTIPQVHVWVS